MPKEKKPKIPDYPQKPITARTSRHQLTSKQRANVNDLYDTIYEKSTPLEAKELEPLREYKSHASKNLARTRGELAMSLEFYEERADRTNPALFPYLTSAQKDVLNEELRFTFHLLSNQYQLDRSEMRRQYLKKRSRQLQRCAYLIEELRESSSETLGELLQKALRDSEKHAKYLGLTEVAPYLSEKIMQFINDSKKIDAKKDQSIDAIMDNFKKKSAINPKEWQFAGITTKIREWMGDVNGRRLYWVWGGGLLSTVISMLPDDFNNKQQALSGVTAPSPITGYMSWILYYARFGLNLGLLLKHTIQGPWMSQEERTIPWQERFKTQWEQRKFALLNDSIWATANMICFLWLVGEGLLGYLGNAMTLGLLLMDVSLTVWRFQEDKTQYKRDLQRYIEDVEQLMLTIAGKQEKLSQAKKKKTDDEIRLLQSELSRLELRLKTAQQARDKLIGDWKYKESHLMLDLTYAASLLGAFGLMCCFLCPPATIPLATTAILGLTGAALCFTLTMAYSATKSYIDIKQLKKSHHGTKQLAQQKLEEIHRLLNEDKKEHKESLTNYKIRQLYLEREDLLTTTKHQNELIQFQNMKLIHSVIVDAMIPPLIFAALTFFPMGIGLGVLAAGLALAVISHFILKRYTPQKAPLSHMKTDEEYSRFLEEVPKLLSKEETETRKKTWSPDFPFSSVSTDQSREGGSCTPELSS